MWKKFIQDYLTFSKKDRTAVIVLVMVFVVITVVPRLLPPQDRNTDIDTYMLQGLNEILTPAHDSAVALDRKSAAEFADYDLPAEHEFFYFDPNTISEGEWIRLGVSRRAASTIHKYLSKGGRFNEPEDLLKIYNLDSEMALQIIPYVRIVEKSTTKSRTFSSQEYQKSSLGSSARIFSRKQYHFVDINTADTAAFATLPGIGNWRADKIVRFRDSLGGFVSVEQLSGISFLPDSIFDKLRPYFQLSRVELRKININTATAEDLLRHPYFNRILANTILAYRNQHGAFRDLAGLRKIHTVDEITFEKIEPYLAVR